MRQKIYFVAISKKKEVSLGATPSLQLDFLFATAKVLEDFCGCLEASALRENTEMLQEILGELLDYGHIVNFDTF